MLKNECRKNKTRYSDVIIAESRIIKLKHLIMFNIGEEFVKLQNTLLKYALHLTHDREEAKELLQETAVTVFTNSDKYNNDGKFAAWVYTIMRNKYLNKVIKIKNHATSTYGEVRDDILYMATEEPYNDYTYDEISALVESLPPLQAYSFSMVIAGYSYKEIAHEAEIPMSQVKSNIYKARIKLKNLLKDEWELPN